MRSDPAIHPLQGHKDWDAVAAHLGRTKAFCYVCGREFETYNHVPVVPPDPSTVLTKEQNVPVMTCGDDYCMRGEQKREQAVWENLPEVEETRARFYADHPKWKGGQTRMTPMREVDESPPKPIPARPWYKEED
jgi:hypothetical protein